MKHSIATAIVFGVMSLLGCEPEIGSPCEGPPAAMCAVAPNPSLNEQTAQLSQDIFFDACSKALCMSTEGSRPYCTARCDGPFDCPDGFVCEDTLKFPPLGCLNPTANGAPGQCDPGDTVVRYCTASSPAILNQRDEAAGRDVWSQEEYDSLQCEEL